MAIIIGKRTNLDAPIKVESLNGVTFTTESEAHQFVVRCEQKGQELTLSGTISAKFVRADGNTVQLVGSISDGAAVVTLAQDCYNVPGRFQLAIFNTVGDTKLCIYACVGTVQRAQSGNLIDGGGIIPDVEDLIADIQAAVQSIPPTYDALLASIAGTYSASKTYAVGDYVWYDGSLYRCTTAITTAEAWTSGHWTAAVLGDDLSVIKSAIEHNGYGYFTPSIVGDGYIARDTGEVVVSGTYKHSDYIDISGFEKLVTSSAYTSDFNAFYDSSKSFISPFSIAVGTDKNITIPSTAKYMRVSATAAKYPDSNVFKALGQYKIDALAGEIAPMGDALDAIRTATSEDEGKALIAKTVTNGKVTEWEFGEAGGGGDAEEDYFIPSIISTGYISNADGSEQANANYSRSDYVDISPYKKLITIASSDGAFNAFYTSGKVFISSFVVRAGTDKVIDVPSNAVYMRVSATTATYNNIYKFRPLPYVNSYKIDDLNTAVANLSDAIANSGSIFSPESVGTGNVSRDDGSIVSGSYLHSDYIDISQFPKLLTMSEYAGDFNAFYDANKSFISVFSIAAGTDKIIEIPDGAMYMRVSASSSKYADTMKFRTLEYVTSDILPYYWFGEIANKCDAVMNHMNTVGKNGDTFPFVTDIHWYRNQQKSPKLIKYLLNHLNINMVVLGGDLITQGTKDAEIWESSKVVEAFKFHDTFVPISFGNHDNNSNQSEASYRFDTNTVYSLFFKGFEDTVNFMTDTEFSFYFDKPTNKMRYICLDMGDDGVSKAFTAYEAFRDVLNSTPSGYSIVIFAHIIDYGTFVTSLSQMIDAYNARTSVTVNSVVCDFTSASGKVIICIGGHRHFDSESATPDGVPITVTDCDAMLSQNTNTEGTITEQCFDVISIDHTNDIAYYDRVGRGESRIIHLTPVSAGTLTSTLTGTITWSSGDDNIATVSNGTVTRVTTGTVIIKADNGMTAEIWVCNS